MRVRDAANLLDVSATRIYQLVKSGSIILVEPGRVDKESVVFYKENRKSGRPVLVSDDKVMSVEDVSKYLGYSKIWVYRLGEQGKLKKLDLGFCRESVEKLKKERGL